jgi:integrase
VSTETTEITSPALPVLTGPPAAQLPAHLENLAETARDYARGAQAENTRRAYQSDWKQFTAWCERNHLEALAPNPEVVGLYLSASAAGTMRAPKRSVATIERLLSAISWHYAQLGTSLDRTDRHITSVLAGIRRRHGRPPSQKEAVLPEDLLAMLATLGHDLRGLRDRAILLIGFAGGLRRSEITGLDCGPDHTEDGTGWIEILDQGIVVRTKVKVGWREVEIGRGSSDATCPVVALQAWLKLGRIAHGPLFRHIAKGGKEAGPDRLTDRHVARLVKRTAMAAGVRSDLSEAERREKFAGHSLRAGLASSAEVDERHVQKQLGHSSAEMTRRYQRCRERFRVNLTKAAGL